MAETQKATQSLPPNEFEVSLAALGIVRGRVEPSTIMEVERRLGSFMELALKAAEGTLSFTAACSLVEVMVRPVMGQGTPTRHEIEMGVIHAGLSNVVRSLHAPFLYVMNGAGRDS